MFFVYERRSSTSFLIDTGAACSLSPLSSLGQPNPQKTDIDSLTSGGLGSISVPGLITHQLHVDFLQLLKFFFMLPSLIMAF